MTNESRMALVLARSLQRLMVSINQIQGFVFKLEHELSVLKDLEESQRDAEIKLRVFEVFQSNDRWPKCGHWNRGRQCFW